MEIGLIVYLPKDKTDVSLRIVQGDLSAGEFNGWVEATLTVSTVLGEWEEQQHVNYGEGPPPDADAFLAVVAHRLADPPA